MFGLPLYNIAVDECQLNNAATIGVRCSADHQRLIIQLDDHHGPVWPLLDLLANCQIQPAFQLKSDFDIAVEEDSFHANETRRGFFK